MAAAQADSICVLPSRPRFERCPDLSFDYAVMERSDMLATVPLNDHWSDIGKWDALAELPLPKVDKDLIAAVKSDNCYVRTDGVRVELLGVDDLVVVATGDRVLIMRKGKSQHIRELASAANGL